MNKGIKKTDNYFERVKQRANRTNYRYYFFDYLYFKGEVWGKKIGRMSGFILLFWYWWWIVVLPGNFLLINNVPQWSSLHLGYLGAMFLLICVFILARYRKARVQALLNRYRRSKHISAVQAYFLFLLPFVLFFLETWLLHNSRKMDNYLELEPFSKDGRLCAHVCDTLKSLPETPTLATYKDYKAIIILLGMSTTHYAILDELAEQHRKRDEIPELTAYCDALHWMRPGRQYLCNVYNTVCHAFHLLRRNPVRDNRLLVTEKELRHAERMLPELGRQTFTEMVRLKGYMVYDAEQLADKCGMEYGSFRRKVKKMTGYTAKEWVIKERAKDVEHYLKNTNLTLTEVAFTTGFASTSNLNDFCKAYLLDTPGEIRRKAQETRKCTVTRT